jgi:urease accessory protein
MANRKTRMSLITSASTNTIARPHPGPLPRGEGESVTTNGRSDHAGLKHVPRPKKTTTGSANGIHRISRNTATLPPLLRERAGVRADVSTKPPPPISDFILWQLADSAFPTGGFAHSLGLEAAWQHGEVRNRTELISFIEVGLQQLGLAALPFVTAAFDGPEKLGEFDQLCDAFTTNHVANRASRAQGRAFLTAVERIFKVGQASRLPGERGSASGFASSAPPSGAGETPALLYAHYAPVFGNCLLQLNVSRETAVRLFFFNQLRGVLAAAVRLNIVGPMEGQILQNRLAPKAEEILRRCEYLPLDDLAQTSPLLDLWQGAQDRLYSRLFQS